MSYVSPPPHITGVPTMALTAHRTPSPRCPPTQTLPVYNNYKESGNSNTKSNYIPKFRVIFPKAPSLTWRCPRGRWKPASHPHAAAPRRCGSGDTLPPGPTGHAAHYAFWGHCSSSKCSTAVSPHVLTFRWCAASPHCCCHYCCCHQRCWRWIVARSCQQERSGY